jgi:AcrR family transcriptional regulator
MSHAALRKVPRDSEATRLRILDAAEQEFADHGLSGARVDAIAARTETNVRMIYYYFGSKDGLYRTVLERAYGRMRENEQRLALDTLPPADAIRTLTEFTFDYQQAHPEFVRLVAIENIHRAAHLRELQPIRQMNASVIETIGRILERGKAEGLFRADAEPIGVHLLITAFCFFRVANRYTLSTVFPLDPLARGLVAPHRRMLVDAVLGYLRSGTGAAGPALPRSAPRPPAASRSRRRH